MWDCNSCRTSFAFESIEFHIYTNHIKPRQGDRPVNVFECGDCSVGTESFEEVARHCLVEGHRPTRVRRGQDFDRYYSIQLFSALEATIQFSSSAPALSSVKNEQRSGGSNLIVTKKTAENGALIQEKIQKRQFQAGILISDDVGFTDWEISASKFSSSDISAFDSLNESDGFDHISSPLTPSATINPFSGIILDVDLEQLKNETEMKKENKGTERLGPFLNNPLPELKTCKLKKKHRKRKDNRGPPKQYQCTHCDKILAGSSVLKRHQIIHTGERPYECDQCQKSSVSNSHRRAHERSHSGETPFSCSVCEKAFAFATSLRTHQRIHSGEKPYQCKFCDTAFSANSNKWAHERRMHPAEATSVMSKKGPETK